MEITENNIAFETVKVRAADSDRFYDATIPFFFTISQEVAGEHATELGVGIKELTAKDMKTWVIVRTKMNFSRIPKWRENLTFETFPQQGFRLFCPRVVKAKDENGEEIMSAMTHWVFMDLLKKRPLPPKMITDSMKVVGGDIALNPDIGKIRKYEEEEKTEILAEITRIPSYYDIDYNRHVNNVVYVRWMCEAIADEITMDYRIEEFDMQWESQTFEGEEVKIETAVTSRDENRVKLCHRVTKVLDGKIAAEANSTWLRK